MDVHTGKPMIIMWDILEDYTNYLTPNHCTLEP